MIHNHFAIISGFMQKPEVPQNPVFCLIGTRRFAEIQPDEMSYKSFLGRSYGGTLDPPFTAINGVRKCPVGQMTLCVTSQVSYSR